LRLLGVPGSLFLTFSGHQMQRRRNVEIRMRTVFFLAGILVTGALASCGTDRPADDQTVVETQDSDEYIAANDVTAIDAATGEAANMAADVEFAANEADNTANNANGDD
jgi:hypothetical protein